jgi:hypothetical protein
MQHVNAAGALAPGFPANGLTLPIVVGGPTGYVFRARGDGEGAPTSCGTTSTAPRTPRWSRASRETGAFAAGWNASGVGQAYSRLLQSVHRLLQLEPPGRSDRRNARRRDVCGRGLPPGSHSVGRWSRTLANGSWAYSAGAPHPLPSANSACARWRRRRVRRVDRVRRAHAPDAARARERLGHMAGTDGRARDRRDGPGWERRALPLRPSRPPRAARVAPARGRRLDPRAVDAGRDRAQRIGPSLCARHLSLGRTSLRVLVQRSLPHRRRERRPR